MTEITNDQEHKCLYFWKPNEENGYYSNWSNHSVTESDKKFNTLEHYLMYHKAILMNDIDTANEILNAKTPSAAKSLGRKVKNWDQKLWNDNCETIMYNGLLLKTMQHPSIHKSLLETGDKIIAEASPYDSIWGIGCTKERANGPDSWTGTNLLGKAWMKVRDSLKQ